MHLIPGIGAGIWICTPKTFNIWRNVFRRKVNLRSNGMSSVPLTGANGMSSVPLTAGSAPSISNPSGNIGLV